MNDDEAAVRLMAEAWDNAVIFQPVPGTARRLGAAVMTAQTVTIDIHAAFWLTSNMRLHWAAKAKLTKSIRDTARVSARMAVMAGRLAPMQAADVTVHVGYPRNGRQDPDNAAPAAKAAIDGCVDAGLLPDDDAEHRPATTYRRDVPTGRPGWYRLRLEFTPTINERQQ